MTSVSRTTCRPKRFAKSNNNHISVVGLYHNPKLIIKDPQLRYTNLITAIFSHLLNTQVNEMGTCRTEPHNKATTVLCTTEYVSHKLIRICGHVRCPCSQNTQHQFLEPQTILTQRVSFFQSEGNGKSMEQLFQKLLVTMFHFHEKSTQL